MGVELITWPGKGMENIGDMENTWLPRSSFFAYLNKAREFGWESEGTKVDELTYLYMCEFYDDFNLSSERFFLDWDGRYQDSVLQIIEYKDAQRLAQALETSLPYLPKDDLLTEEKEQELLFKSRAYPKLLRMPRDDLHIEFRINQEKGIVCVTQIDETGRELMISYHESLQPAEQPPDVAPLDRLPVDIGSDSVSLVSNKEQAFVDIGFDLDFQVYSISHMRRLINFFQKGDIRMR